MWQSDIDQALANLKIEVEASGHKPGTPSYNSALLEKRVGKCQEMRGVPSCGGCTFVEYCSLIKEYLLDVKYNTTPQQ